MNISKDPWTNTVYWSVDFKLNNLAKTQKFRTNFTVVNKDDQDYIILKFITFHVFRFDTENYRFDIDVPMAISARESAI